MAGITVTLSNDLLLRLRALATERGTSVSAVAREIIEEELPELAS